MLPSLIAAPPDPSRSLVCVACLLQSANTLYYWPIKARNVLARLVAHAGKIPLEQVMPEWPAFKPETVFGQLPHLDFGGMKVSQVR